LPKTCINRIKKRGSERTLFEEREKLEKVYKNFKKVLADYRWYGFKEQIFFLLK